MTEEEEAELYASLTPEGEGVMTPEAFAEPPPDTSAYDAAQGAAPPPAGVPVFEDPEFGPPAPDPTDSIALPPAQSGIPTRDPGQDFVPPVPREAPGNVGAPAPLPGSPEAMAAQRAPSEPGAPEDVATATARARESRDAAIAAQGPVDEVEAARKREEAAIAAERTRQADEHVKKAEEIQKRYDTADAAARAHAEQTRAAVKSFKIKDFFADKSTARRFMSKLGVALGAFGAALTHTPNYALQILNKEMDDHHKGQLDQLAALKDEDVMARTGIADARDARGKAMADIQLSAAQLERVTAKQLEEAAARSTSDNYKNVTALHAAKLRESADAKDLEAIKGLRSLSLQEQEKAARLKQIEADTAMKGARTAGTGGFAKRPKGGGTGGGGGGALNSAATKLTTMIEEAKAAGNPMSQGQIYAAADDLKIPHDGKAGAVSVKSILGGMNTLGAMDSRGGKLDLAEDKQVMMEADKFSKQYELQKIIHTQQAVGEMVKKLKDAPNNPHVQANIFEQSVSAARGGAATRTALELAMNHMGGKWDGVQGFISHVRSGEFGPKQIENLKGAINVELASQQQKGKEAFDAYTTWMNTLPAEKQPAAERERTRLFSGMSGFGGKSHGEGAQGKRVKNKKTGEMGTLTADGTFHPDGR